MVVQVHLPEIRRALRMLVAAARHVPVWRYHLAPRLQGLGRTPDRESDPLAPLTARLLVEAHAQQLQLELVDFRRLRRRHRRQEPTRRVQGAVRVVAGEEFLMRSAVAVASHLTDEAALGRPEDRPEYLVPRLPHQIEERREVPLRDTAVANLRIVDERPQRSHADLLRIDRALRLAVDELAEPRLQQFQRLADPFVVGLPPCSSFPRSWAVAAAMYCLRPVPSRARRRRNRHRPERSGNWSTDCVRASDAAPSAGRRIPSGT